MNASSGSMHEQRTHSSRERNRANQEQQQSYGNGGGRNDRDNQREAWHGPIRPMMKEKQCHVPQKFADSKQLGKFPPYKVLTAVAGDMDRKCADTQCEPLRVYEGTSHPGQHGGCYKKKQFKEADAEKNLKARLEELLQPSTSERDLNQIPHRKGMCYCPYLLL